MPDELVPRPATGRVFSAERRVRLSDVSPRGRLRFDAIARYLQDVASDDSADAGLGSEAAWVVRRTVIRVDHAAEFREWLTLSTWCSGTGSRWAERRTSVVGTGGAAIEAASLWVHVDIETGRPARLPTTFDSLFGPAAGGRTVRARLSLPPPADGAARHPWTGRFADFDVLGHVNNAVYWAVVEEELSRRRDLRGQLLAVMEYGGGIVPGDEVQVLVADDPDGIDVWLLDGDIVPASARVTRVLA